MTDIEKHYFGYILLLILLFMLLYLSLRNKNCHRYRLILKNLYLYYILLLILLFRLLLCLVNKSSEIVDDASQF